MSEKAQEKITLDSLEAKLKSLESRIEIAEKAQSLVPRRAADQTPLDPKKIAQSVQEAEKARETEALEVTSMFGPLKPAPKYE